MKAFHFRDGLLNLLVLKRHNLAKKSKILFSLLYLLGSYGNVASMPKAPYINYSCIFYFGHVCPKLNLFNLEKVISR